MATRRTGACERLDGSHAFLRARRRPYSFTVLSAEPLARLLAVGAEGEALHAAYMAPEGLRHLWPLAHILATLHLTVTLDLGPF